MNYSLYHPIFCFCPGHFFGAPKRRAAETAPRPRSHHCDQPVLGGWGGDAAGVPGDLADEAMPGGSAGGHRFQKGNGV